MRRRKVIPVASARSCSKSKSRAQRSRFTIGWPKRLASELDGARQRAAVARVAQRRRVPVSPARNDSNRNSIYMRLWIIMDEAEGESARPYAAAPSGRDYRFQPFPHNHLRLAHGIGAQ